MKYDLSYNQKYKTLIIKFIIQFYKFNKNHDPKIAIKILFIYKIENIYNHKSPKLL